MILISNATTEDIPAIQKLAENTWWATYGSILSKEQLQYMLGRIYSTESLSGAMEDGSQKFILLKDERGTQAFASFGPRKERADVYKLHKLYVLPDNQGKGYGRMLIDEVKSRVKNDSVSILDLNVNRFNPAKTFYEKLGFKVMYEEDVPVGPYFMNDYVMRLEW